MSLVTNKARAGSDLEIHKTSYLSKAVHVPDSFLSTSSANVGQVTYNKIKFSETPLPEYEGLYAVVLDNVLSPSECKELLQLAQASAGADEPGVDNDGWQPALVNAGPQGEFLATDYRNSDRIIWDNRTIVERLLERCFLAKQLQADLSTLEDNEFIFGQRAIWLKERWKVTRLNERMRFLRYGKGQFFKEHCDAAYRTPDGRERTFYTVHLYLNDSLNGKDGGEATEEDEPAPFPEFFVKGGATTFWSKDLQRRLEVDPKAGRVLIFQHRGLLHSGDEVLEGIKYTVRTDLLFEIDESGKPGEPLQEENGESGRPPQNTHTGASRKNKFVRKLKATLGLSSQ